MEDGGFRRDKEERKEWFCEAGARSRMAYNCGHVNQNFIVRPRNPLSSPGDTQSQQKWQLLQILTESLD